MNHCIDTPISWFSLELFHLKELPSSEMARVERHLTACSVCSRCLDSIKADTRSLPPLPVPEPRKPWFLVRPRVAWSVGTLAVVSAMLLLLVVQVRPPEMIPEQGFGPTSYKGGDVSLTVIRQRNGTAIQNPVTFRDNDRFRLLVTSPQGSSFDWQVVVFQGDEAHFPYDANQEIPPGNRVPIPGSFSLTGSTPTEICLVIGDAVPSRQTIESEGKQALPEDAVCVVLHPG